MKTIKSALRSLTGNPVKSTLTLLTVGLGVAVLILAISVSTFLSRTLTEALEGEGIIITFANAQRNDEGNLEIVMPPQIDQGVVDIVRSEVDGLRSIAPLANPFWNNVRVGDTTYQLRSIAASTEEYADVMGFEVVAGNAFTAEDVTNGNRVVIISESLADVLFGSVEDALGATIQPPSREFGRGQNRAPSVQNFTVIGIFADPGELRRKSYGVADLVVPYTSILPAGVDVRMAQRFLLGNLAMRVEGVKFETAEAQLREVLSREYGEDLVLEVWEGTPRGENDTIVEARQTVNIFSLVVNILGFVLLITGSIGILSIMLVEILGRTKEISLERAMGASRSAIMREYFSRSVILTLISVAAGIVLSVVFSRALTQILAPLFDTLSIARGTGGVLDPFAIVIGAAVALIIGGIFGVFPVLSTLKLNIADGIREV